MKDGIPAKKPAKKGLTEQQVERVKKIADDACLLGVDPLDPSSIKAARKHYADKVKACDRILAIIAPPKKKEG
jgi:hypothetical protein